MPSAPTGPLNLAPVFVQKVWASPQLPPPLNRFWSPPPDTGEIWLASDHLRVTPVASGPLAGMGLDEVIRRWPEWLLGPDRGGRLPLLLKVLSVGQWLSVQVHPGDEAARRLEGEPWGKSEAWLILDAQPGAEMILGLKPGVDRAGVKQAVERADLAGVLGRRPVISGETYLIEPGTVHSPGPGITLFEVQQASDVTYRLYDWDRPGLDGRPRDLHIAQALEVLNPAAPAEPRTPQARQDGPVRIEDLASSPHFNLRRVSLTAPYRPQPGRGPVLWVALSGKGRLEYNSEPAQEMAAGQCWLLPAGLDQVSLNPLEAPLVILESLAGPAGPGPQPPAEADTRNEA